MLRGGVSGVVTYFVILWTLTIVTLADSVGGDHMWCGLGLAEQVNSADLVARASVVSRSKVVGGSYLATFRIDKLLHSRDDDLMTKFLRLQLNTKRHNKKDPCNISAKVKPNNKYLVMVKKKGNKQVGIFASTAHFSFFSPPIKSTKKLIREVKSILGKTGDSGKGGDGIQKVRVRRGRRQQSSNPPEMTNLVPGVTTEVTSRTTGRKGRRSTTRLSCSARGNPPPTLYWTLNGKVIENSQNTKITTKNLSKFLRKSVLRLKGSVSRSSVHLQCHAYNAYGHTSKVKMGKTFKVSERKEKTETPKRRKSSNNRLNGFRKSPLKGLKSSRGRSRPGLMMTEDAIGIMTPLPDAGPLSSTRCPIPDFCMNGGTCQFYSTIGEQTCHCAKGYRGRRCERKYVSTTGSLGAHMSDKFPLCLLGMAHYPCQ